MSWFQGIIFAYCCYLIYSGIRSKKNLKQANPIFPDEEINNLLPKIDKTLTLCSSISLFLGIFILLTLLIDMVFPFKNITHQCITCQTIANYLFIIGFFLLPMGFVLSQYGYTPYASGGDLNVLKKTFKQFYETQKWRKKDNWVDTYDKNYSWYQAKDMHWHKKHLLRAHTWIRLGLYLSYFSLFVLTWSYILGTKYI